MSIYSTAYSQHSRYSQLSECDEQLESLVISATEKGLIETVKFFINEGIDIGQFNMLCAAAKSGNLEMINYLYNTVYNGMEFKCNLKYYISVSCDYNTAEFFRRELIKV